MKIGIIGTGEIGGTLVRQFSKAGHKVKMTNASGPEKLQNLALETGAIAVPLAEVVTDIDVIVLSIPTIAVPALPTNLFKNTPAGVPIIDTCNYYPIRDGIIQKLEDGVTESVWVSSQIQRSVIKAYNSIFYGSLASSGVQKNEVPRIALPVAGDDKQAKEIVVGLIDDSGFDALDYGSLSDSWRQQPGSPVYCTDLTLSQLEKSIKNVKKDLLAKRREQGLQHILTYGPAEWRNTVVYNRQTYQSVLD